MAWSISHTPEAWENIRSNLMHWNKDKLIQALSDDRFEEIEKKAGLVYAENASAVLTMKLNNLPMDILVDAAIECIQNHMTCSNGGFEFWIDREGYHTVSVDKKCKGCNVCK